MKLYTLYSKSHVDIFEKWFLPSLKLTNPNIDLRCNIYDQVCPSGNFMETGWKETMIIKNELIVNSLNETEEGEIIIHSDIDIQFFKDIKKNLNLSLFIDNDIICQEDAPSVFCYGFMIIKNNIKTKNMFKHILETVKQTKHTDQELLNKLYKQFNVSVLAYDNSYFSIWMKNGCKVWNGEEVPNIPNNLILHHANWTVGVENKIKLLNMVKKFQTC